MQLQTHTPAQLINVSKLYGTGENTITALSNVSVSFPKGSFTAIMGPSGSGKTTLLQCLAGMERPTSGEVVLAGKQLQGLSETAVALLRRRHAGFVFQSFNLMPSLNVVQNIALPLRLAGQRPTAEAMAEVLKWTELSDRATHLPGQLSGGQQQRVALARALIVHPEVLFADEPTGALDSSTGQSILRLLRRSVDEQQQTVIMVTHDPVAAAYADSVLLLVDGRIIDKLPRSDASRIAARMTQLEAEKLV